MYLLQYFKNKTNTKTLTVNKISTVNKGRLLSAGLRPVSLCRGYRFVRQLRFLAHVAAALKGRFRSMDAGEQTGAVGLNEVPDRPTEVFVFALVGAYRGAHFFPSRGLCPELLPHL